ncbi:MAG: hypothetical protein VKJ86_00120, partial [Synechococcus sp.]|nr:hypothetical protein [Synechococcus sp.]
APSIGGQMARSTASDPNEGFAVMDEAESQTTAIAPRFVNPQQQVENYFQAQWQSPPDLQETLEYRLSFSDQGVIRTVFPIGKAAELYQPQLSFLAVGRGVGINLPAENRTFRLVLNPDGRVQTFLEAPR